MSFFASFADPNFDFKSIFHDCCKKRGSEQEKNESELFYTVTINFTGKNNEIIFQISYLKKYTGIPEKKTFKKISPIEPYNSPLPLFLRKILSFKFLHKTQTPQRYKIQNLKKKTNKPFTKTVLEKFAPREAPFMIEKYF